MCNDDNCGKDEKDQCCSTVPDCRDFGGLINECPPMPDKEFLLMSQNYLKLEKLKNMLVTKCKFIVN